MIYSPAQVEHNSLFLIMQEPHRQPSSYFSFTPRSHESASSTPPVSPGASLDRVSPVPQRNPPIRPSSAPRTVSDYKSMQPRVKVQTIEEDAVHGGNPQEQVNIARHSQAARWSSEIRASTASTRKSVPNSTHSSPVTHRHVLEKTDSPTARRSSVAEPPFRPRPGHRWSRTKSGSVWYERLKGSSAHSKNFSDPSQTSSVPKRLITPLEPPTPRSQSRGPPYRHRVRVEKSFTNLQPEKKVELISKSSHNVISSGSRHSSINPLRLFSAPLQLIRKVSLPKPKWQHNFRSTSPTRSVPTLQATEMRGHKSLLKRTYTSEALREVTSILHETAPQSGAYSPVTIVKPLNFRQMSDKSGSSKESKQKRSPLKAATGLISEVPSLTRRSTHDLLDPGVHSYTTSQLELRMGGQPANTPDEKATYRAKRSPSAESEEFLKVDISVRGGTSYLPSEARRIHTPPLPNEGPDGKRRGFFFDYTAPKSRPASASGPSPPGLELPSVVASIPQRSTSNASTVHECTFFPRPEKQERISTRSKTCDWYDAKLAEIDESDGEQEQPERPTLGRTRSATTKSGTSLAEFKKKREEEMFDYNIPEHLPSSPLCPRHPRYWRVVQGRGSQFRGCWMHGVGEFREGEGRVAGKSIS